MAVKFNPFTGQLQIDEKGSGGGSSYIDGEVAAYGDLSLDAGVAPLNSAWLVREASGTWLLGRKPAGIYIRTATAGVSRDADYTYAGILPDVFSDANFTLYDDGDSTKNAKFQLSGIATGTTRTITVPNKNVTLDDAGDSRTPTAHAASHAAGTKAEYNDQVAGMTENVFIRANNAGTAGNSITLTFDGVDDIGSALSAWNSANPSNQATLIGGVDSQVPDNGEEITLSGGVAGGSDPFKNINQDLGTQDEVAFAKLTLTAPANGEVIRIDGVGADANDVGFAVYNTTGDQANSFYFNQNNQYVGIGVGDGEGYIQANVPLALPNIKNSLVIRDGDGGQLATFDANTNLTANRTYDLPDRSGELMIVGDAPASHAHGNLTNDGKLGSTAGLPVVTTTAGAVTTLALGTANQVLRVNSGATGVEFADPAASGVTGAAASASDVLGVSGANITGVDANADRIVYWNNTSNKLAYGTPADAGAAAASHTHAASDITSGLAASATTDTTNASNISSGTLGTARLGTGTANSGTFLRGDQTWAAVSGVTTGSVDNAVLRADGTGGSTSQSSDINILDATTSTQNNVAITNEHSGQTNSALVLQPKGTGALIAGARPTGAASTGNARGVAAIDLQMTRSAATQVASGDYAVIGGGRGNTASANDNVVCGGRNNTASSNFSDLYPAAVCGGYNNTASNFGCFVGGGVNNTASTNRASLCAGDGNTSSGYASFVGAGEANTANATYASVLGGNRSLADRHGLFANAAGMFAATGDAQSIRAVLRCKTTTNAAVEMALDGSTTYLTIPSGKVIFLNIKVVGSRSTGADVATYERQYAVKNVAGTSSEVYAPVTIGTDNAAGTTLEVAVVDAGDYIRIRPTGVASQIWRWVASVDAVEVAYGT